MMRDVALDTDVASLLIKESLPAALEARLVGMRLTLPFVTYAELYRWPMSRNWGPRGVRRLESWIGRHPFLLGSEEVAETYAHLAEQAFRRGRPRPMNDMWIAACCLARNLPLATLNIKDFDDFRAENGLEIITA